MQHRIGDIDLSLRRPEYMALLEGLISALAWSRFTTDNEQTSGLVFIEHGNSNPKTFKLSSTSPSSIHERASFGEKLVETGLELDDVAEETLAAAVINSVGGILSPKSTAQAATPLSAGFALLQNPRGVVKKANPASYARIIEDVYRLGTPPPDKQQQKGTDNSAAGRWLRSAQQRCSVDPFLKALDSVVLKELVPDGNFRSTQPNYTDQTDLYFPSSPFSWFYHNWNLITSERWVKALPARVWTDWATTILRVGLGASYLWEANWYIKVARAVIGKSNSSWEDLGRFENDLIPWVSSRASVSSRDISSVLKGNLSKGRAVASVLTDFLDKGINRNDPFAYGIATMQKNTELQEKIRDALNNSDDQKVTNTWEFIRYLLSQRNDTGSNIDYYGLLKKNHRYLTVNPGTEWITVIASLACNAPGRKTNVGAVLKSLESIGCVPEIGDLVALLEAAGLARGSADADRGVIVESAY